MLASGAATVGLLVFHGKTNNFHHKGSGALFGGIHTAIPSWRTNSFLNVSLCP